MHCPAARGPRAAQLLQCTASLPGGRGQCNPCNALPHCLGAVGSATPAMQCRTALGAVGSATPATPVMPCLIAPGQWAVELLQCTAPLPGGSGQCNSCNALPHCLGAVDSAAPAMHCLTALGAVGSGNPAMQWAVQLVQCTAPLSRGSGQCNSCNAPPHCLGTVGTGTPAMHCLTTWEQWAAQLLQCTASLPGGRGQCNPCNALPHCLGAVGSATPAIQCRTALGAVGSATPATPVMPCLISPGQCAVELLQCTVPLPGGSGQCNSCNALPHCLGAVDSAAPPMHCLTALGAVGSRTHAMHRLTAMGQWAVEILQCTASLPGGSGQCNSCNALPHCLGAVGSVTPAMHRLTAVGQ